MIMKVFVINQKKAASNHNLFGNVKIIHKYNVRSSLIATVPLLQNSDHQTLTPAADEKML
ncbi:hypothetical protein EDC53_10714 [Phytobacter diazotrophicus]|nr:hypothetical protein EDC53_10714 [Phytobacter diazotrophicus]